MPVNDFGHETHADRHGTGSFARRYRFHTIDAGTVVAGLEDDMHRFELVLRHDGAVVRAVEGHGVRTPWSPCDDAATVLDRLIGLPLTRRLSEVARWTQAREQCTHQFDLATLAVGHAASGREERDLLAVVPDWTRPPYEGFLSADGDLLLHWVIGAEVIEAPAPFTGRSPRGGFVAWCEEHLDPDLVEAAFALQRAVWISPARLIDVESCTTVAESGLRPGVCFTSQPGRVEVAFRHRGSLRDFGRDPQSLLAGWPSIDVGP